MSWERKSGTAVLNGGPLTGRALERMQAMPTPTLAEWIDNSLTKIGKLVVDGQRGGFSMLLADAEKEAAALVQALRELGQRGGLANGN